MITKTNLFIAAIATLLFACGQAGDKKEAPVANKENTPVKKEIKKEQVSADSLKETLVVPTLENKIPIGQNVIYSAAFMFAWHKLEEQFDGKVYIDNSNSNDFNKVVKSKTYKDVLLPEEYEADVNIDGATGAIVAIAKFNKRLSFAQWFHEMAGPLKFNGKGGFEYFGITNYHDDVVISQMKIKHYNNNDDFIISLQPKDDDHEIILVMDKGYGTTLTDIFKTAQNKINATAALVKKHKVPTWKTYFTRFDQLAIPNIEFFVKATYHNIEGQSFKSGKDPHLIIEAWQSINFKLDRKGATLVDEGFMMADSAVIETEKPQPKFMVFNKPFAIFLKRKDAKNPYFGMMINNTELLVPFKK